MTPNAAPLRQYAARIVLEYNLPAGTKDKIITRKAAPMQPERTLRVVVEHTLVLLPGESAQTRAADYAEGLWIEVRDLLVDGGACVESLVAVEPEKED